ncbi:MAG TPA: response regulator transcription factor [Sulfurovum sp.]|nr:response regulator transcription factor [Sulfurovum sp.]
MSNLSELTLLYVEDDKELREQFIRILKPEFKEIYEASDGLKALEQYEQYSPDMMLIDINLPKIDGLEVIEKIRKSDKTTPIVILSAYSDQKKLLRAITLGLSEYLIKPVPHKKLLALFEEMALSYEKKMDKKNIIRLQNGYFWKKEEKILLYHDEIIPLTKRERILLEFMMQQCNRVISFESITNLIWEDEEYSIAYNALSHLLKRLRKKFPEELIQNIYGEGYRITSV